MREPNRQTTLSGLRQWTTVTRLIKLGALVVRDRFRIFSESQYTTSVEGFAMFVVLGRDLCTVCAGHIDLRLLHSLELMPDSLSVSTVGQFDRRRAIPKGRVFPLSSSQLIIQLVEFLLEFANTCIGKTLSTDCWRRWAKVIADFSVVITRGRY